MTIAETRPLGAKVWAREANEHYVEPEWCSRRLFEEEEFYGKIWDPCCGFGRIPEAALAFGHKDVCATDIIDRGYAGLDRTGDFLECVMTGAACIVCNPPFNIAGRFAQHALSQPSVQKVAMIFPTARLNAAHWLKGTPLARVWLMTPRPSMPPGYTITAGEKPGGGKMDFCWLVWTKGRSGPADLLWLRKVKAVSQTESANDGSGNRA